MGRVTIVKGQYTERRDVVNAVYYALNLQKCRHLLCWSNLILGNDFMLSPESVASQFIAIQEASPISFHRRIYHIGYDLDRALDVYGIIPIVSIGLAICRLYPTYQSFFAVHENTKNLHLHLIINNIPVYGDRPLSRFIDMNNMVYISDLVLAECDRLCNLNRLADANPHIIVREAFREYRNNTKWYRCS